MSPAKYLSSFKPLKEPWNMYRNQENDFDYDKNKNAIRKNLKTIKKKYKILQPVRIRIK